MGPLTVWFDLEEPSPIAFVCGGCRAELEATHHAGAGRVPAAWQHVADYELELHQLGGGGCQWCGGGNGRFVTAGAAAGSEG
jgi:hypothetical protein